MSGDAGEAAVAALRSALRPALADLPAGATVVIACSGGADSLALLAATVAEAAARSRRVQAGLRVVGATVDHGLQDDSAQHAARVVEQMARLGADETLTARVEVHSAGRGPEAAAREARYAVLEQIAEHTAAAAVLLGHTLDDQAETVLLGLARGSGGRSLAGMRRAFGVFRRPLLDLERAQTEAACRAQGLDFWSDPHNDDPRFTRSRVRRRVLPVLRDELNPQISRNLARTADLLRADAEALDEIADSAYARSVQGEGRALRISDSGLREEPRAIRTRVLRRAAVGAGALDGELFAVHVTALDDLLLGPRGLVVRLPGRLTARRVDGGIDFVATPPMP